MKNTVRGTLVWFAVLLAVWEIIARSGVVSKLVLPPLADVMTAFAKALIGGGLMKSTAISMLFVVSGIAAGAILAFILSAMSFQFTAIKRLADMLTAVMHPLPGVALLPIFILFFGIGWRTLTVVIIHSVVWPLSVNFSAGFASVPAVYRKIGANYRLKPAVFFFRIMLPASFPYVFSGLRTAWARAWRAAVSAEMIFGIVGSGGGLGWFVYSKRIFMDTAGMYAGILMLALIGIAVESGLFYFIESKTLKKWEAA